MEVCTTMLMELFQFHFDSAPGNHGFWLSWIEIVALADVPEANLILRAWIKGAGRVNTITAMRGLLDINFAELLMG